MFDKKKGNIEKTRKKLKWKDNDWNLPSYLKISVETSLSSRKRPFDKTRARLTKQLGSQTIQTGIC